MTREYLVCLIESREERGLNTAYQSSNPFPLSAGGNQRELARAKAAKKAGASGKGKPKVRRRR